MSETRILIIDDHQLILSGLHDLLLSEFPDASVDAVSSGSKALSILDGAEYDVVLADLVIPGEEMFFFLRNVAKVAPDLSVVVLSANDSDGHIRKCVELGAMGFVSKSASQDELVDALKQVMSGGMVLPASYNPNKRAATEGLDLLDLEQKLSERQLEVCKLIARGKSNKEIAYEFGLSENTIKVHVSNILKAVGVDNRTQVSVLLQRLGIN